MSKASTTDFESSLQKLEEIVESMEEESIPLEQLLKHYEQGNSLIKDCEASLKAARKQLETIRTKSQKKTPAPSTKEGNSDDEIRLF